MLHNSIAQKAKYSTVNKYLNFYIYNFDYSDYSLINKFILYIDESDMKHALCAVAAIIKYLEVNLYFLIHFS